MSYPAESHTQNAVVRAPSGYLPGPSSAPNHGPTGQAPAGGFSGSEAPAGGRLGSKREYFHPEGGDGAAAKAARTKKTRLNVLADQRQAASIYRSFLNKAERAGLNTTTLAGRGVCMCGWTQIAEHQAKLRRVKQGDGYRSWISGAQMCGLRWVCPVCTAKSAENDRQMVCDGLAAVRGSGKQGPRAWPVMLTLTTRHTIREAAKDILDGISTAEQRLKRLKVWTRLMPRCLGFARVLEWTFGKHGFHPHYHVILLVDAESEEAAMAAVQTLQGAYMRQLDAAGRDGSTPAAWRHSFQVQSAAAVKNYMTKWGTAEELTGAQRKDGGDGLTPWQLLRLSRTADTDKERRRAAARWWEIIQASKNRSQLYKSEDWKKLVEEYRQDHPGEEQPDPETVVELGAREKRSFNTPRFDAAQRRSIEVREAAEREPDLLLARHAVEQVMKKGRLDAEILEEMEDLDQTEEGVVIDEDDADVGPTGRNRPDAEDERGQSSHRGGRRSYPRGSEAQLSRSGGSAAGDRETSAGGDQPSGALPATGGRDERVHGGDEAGSRRTGADRVRQLRALAEDGPDPGTLLRRAGGDPPPQRQAS